MNEQTAIILLCTYMFGMIGLFMKIGYDHPDVAVRLAEILSGDW